jgi:hypothetical protein
MSNEYVFPKVQNIVRVLLPTVYPVQSLKVEVIVQVVQMTKSSVLSEYDVGTNTSLENHLRMRGIMRVFLNSKLTTRNENNLPDRH